MLGKEYTEQMNFCVIDASALAISHYLVVLSLGVAPEPVPLAQLP